MEFSLQRVRRDLWFALRHLGMLALALKCSSPCRRKLHHGCVLVHCIDFLRQSSCHHRAFVVRHFLRNSTCRCSFIHRSANRGSPRRNSTLPLARSEPARCRRRTAHPALMALQVIAALVLFLPSPITYVT